MEKLQPAASVGAVLATVLFLITILRHCQRKYKLPPGPRPWPVIGNLNLIGPLPHRSVRELSQRYGPLMSLRFGSIPVVVGSSVEMAKFFLKTHDQSFIDRPRIAAGKYTGFNFSDVLWSPYGPYWRQARKLWKTEIFSTRRLAAYEHVRAEEVRAMLHDVNGDSAGGKRAVTLRDHITTVNLSVISRMVLGSKKYVVDDGGGVSPATTPEEFRWMVKEFFVLNGVFNIGDFIPWLGWMDPQGYVRRMKRLGKMFDRFFEQVLEEHSERRQREGEAFVATDLVDLLLELADDPGLEVPMDRDAIKGFILDLMVGGTDTSTVTTEWAMSELLKSPEVLVKATEELDRVIGRNRLVTEEDIPSLPYLEAIVKETMRLHPVTPMLAPRLSRQDASVGGYDIPAGTLVLVNVWAIGRDPTVWDDDAPEDFRPERFVGSSVDVKGQDYELLPFGAGRRMCVGIGLGLKMVQLTLANLLHAFAWRLPDGMVAEELSMEEMFALSMLRLVPLEAVPEPKLPAHLYVGP